MYPIRPQQSQHNMLAGTSGNHSQHHQAAPANLLTPLEVRDPFAEQFLLLCPLDFLAKRSLGFSERSLRLKARLV